MVYMVLFPTPSSRFDDSVMKCPDIDIAMNLLGRMDSPWALYEGGTPQVFSLTLGHGRLDHHGAFQSPTSYVLKPGQWIDLVSAQAFASYDNPRISSGFYSLEKEPGALVLKRTKSYALIPCDYTFSSLRTLAEKLMRKNQE